MKPHWTTYDYAEMIHHGLPFAAEDLELLRKPAIAADALAVTEPAHGTYAAEGRDRL